MGFWSISMQDMVTKLLHEQLLKLCELLTSSPMFISTREARDMEGAVACTEEMLSQGIQLNEAVFCSIISGYASAGNNEAAEHWFEKFKAENLVPGGIVYNSIVQAYCQAGNMETVEALLAQMEEEGFQGNLGLYTTVLNGFAEIRDEEKCLSFFHRLKACGLSPTAATYGCIVKLFTKQAGNMAKALDILEEMDKHGVSPNKMIYAMIMDGYARGGDFTAAFKVWEDMVSAGLKPDIVIYNILVHAFCKAGRMDKALGVLENIEANRLLPTIETYTSILDGYVKGGNIQKALEVFDRIKTAGLRPGVVSYNSLLSGLAKARQMENARLMLNEMLANGVVPNERSYTALTEGYARAGDVEKAFGMFQRMKKENLAIDIVAYGALLKACCKSGAMQRAAEVFQQITDAGLKHNRITYCTMLDGWARKGELSKARDLLNDMQKHGFHLDTICYTSFIKACFRSGDTEQEVTETLAVMREKKLEVNARTYTTLIHGWLAAADPDQAISCYEQAKASGLQLDSALSNCLLSGLISCASQNSTLGEKIQAISAEIAAQKVVVDAAVVAKMDRYLRRRARCSCFLIMDLDKIDVSALSRDELLAAFLTLKEEVKNGNRKGITNPLKFPPSEYSKEVFLINQPFVKLVKTSSADAVRSSLMDKEVLAYAIGKMLSRTTMAEARKSEMSLKTYHQSFLSGCWYLTTPSPNFAKRLRRLGIEKDPIVSEEQDEELPDPYPIPYPVPRDGDQAGLAVEPLTNETDAEEAADEPDMETASGSVQPMDGTPEKDFSVKVWVTELNEWITVLCIEGKEWSRDEWKYGLLDIYGSVTLEGGRITDESYKEFREQQFQRWKFLGKDPTHFHVKFTKAKLEEALSSRQQWMQAKCKSHPGISYPDKQYGVANAFVDDQPYGLPDINQEGGAVMPHPMLFYESLLKIIIGPRVVKWTKEDVDRALAARVEALVEMLPPGFTHFSRNHSESEEKGLDVELQSPYCAKKEEQRLLLCLLRKMENARLMLDETLANDVVPSERIYTAFTEGYARTGDVEKAFGVFQRAIDVVAYGALLKACCNSGAMHGAAEVFQQITDAGLKHNQITYCTMLDGLIGRFFRVGFENVSSNSCLKRLIPRASKIFERDKLQPVKNKPVFRRVENPLLDKKVSKRRKGTRHGKAWLETGRNFTEIELIVLSPAASSLAQFLRMQEDATAIWNALDNLPRGHDTWDNFMSVVVHFWNYKDWPRVTQMCEWVLQGTTFRPDLGCYNLLIDAYGKSLNIEDAEKTFNRMQEALCVPNEETFGVLINGYRLAGSFEKAEELFVQMQKRGYSPGPLACNTFLHVLEDAKEYRRAEALFRDLEKYECEPNIDTYNRMIVIYGKAGEPSKAEMLYRSMRRAMCPPNICTFTALMNAFARQGLYREAERYFDKLQEFDYKPDHYAYNALMEAYSQGGSPAGALEIFQTMQRNGCFPDTVSHNILINAYGRAGLYEDAEKIFKSMQSAGFSPNLKSNMLLLSAYARAGRVEEAEELVSAMERDGTKPDTLIYNSLINAYGVSGRHEDMEALLAKMVKSSSKQTKPDIGTYNTLIQVYAQAGFIPRAEELFQGLARLKLVPDATTWTALMGGYAKKKLYRKCTSILKKMLESGCRADAVTARVLFSACRSPEQVEQVTQLMESLQGR
ncbi:uncharacterized protein LOC9641190 [Selaginella moellendorffii]|uniref:uncharacterized protein LOC9641190 n=1 Tax=Selaginella moellendorffii TaxID=88036 RepID=UPI000D1CC58B|nr:uncharacterized protein LOC9641190 [Selaginella moellendorffii]|eukprot:XP_024523852.1 uncharacterized protein LOC9641190 [Selaginella moellendorffii]